MGWCMPLLVPNPPTYDPQQPAESLIPLHGTIVFSEEPVVLGACSMDRRGYRFQQHGSRLIEGRLVSCQLTDSCVCVACWFVALIVCECVA